MAEGKEFVLTLKAKDLASDAIKKLSEGMGATTSAAKTLAKAGAKTFSAIGGAIVVANNAVQLFKTGFDAISGLVTDSLDAVRELRGETNPLVLEMNSLATESLAAKAALGSAFASALIGISKGFKNANMGIAGFLDKNRALIATKIVQFLFKIALALNSGIADALQLTNTVWATMNATVDEAIVSLAGYAKGAALVLAFLNRGNAAGKMFAKGVGTIAQASDDAEERIKNNVITHGKFADQIETVRLRIKALIDEGYKPALAATKALAEAAGDTPMESMAEALLRVGNHANSMRFALAAGAKLISSGMGAEEGTIAFDRFQTKLDGVNQLIGVATTNSVAALKTSVEGLYRDLGKPISIDIDLNNLEQSKQALALYAVQLEIALKAAREGFNAVNGELDLNKTKIEETGQTALEAAGVISGALGQAMISLAEGQATLAEATLNALSMVMSAVVQVALNSIIASALTGQANAIAGNLGIPVWGLGIGIAAGLAALAAISALKSQLPEPKKFAQGGLVTGGIPGVDSVPALLTPGEFVLTKDQTDRMGGGGITINLTSQIPPTKAELKKFVRQNILPALNGLQAQGIT